MKDTSPDTSKNALAAPLLVGDHPALDFVNSVLAPGGSVMDFLQDGSSLAHWLDASGVLPAPIAQTVAAWPTRQQDRLAEQARGLREELRRFLLGRASGGDATVQVRDADIEFINLWLRNSPLLQTLTGERGSWTLALTRDLSRPDGVTAALAALCADLICNATPADVRKCENPACTLWFNDNKRGPRRRWCSMTICGNRMKVAAHRSRKREAPDA